MGRKPEAEGLYVYGHLSHSLGETNTASRSNTLQQTTQRREMGGTRGRGRMDTCGQFMLMDGSPSQYCNYPLIKNKIY